MKDLQVLLDQMKPEDRRWILGNETTDGLLEAFDYKRVVHAGVGGKPIMDSAKQQEAWEAAMDMEPSSGWLRSAYIHIPFCETKCSYCGFFQNASQEEIVSRYTDAVIEELEMASHYKRAQKGVINTVYFGGGTPSTLATKDIVKLVEAVRHYLPLANDCEITLESRIHDMSQEKIDAAISAGVNRFSLGVQSFDTKIRQTVGRIDEEKEVIAALHRLLHTDSASIVIDLMFGLPYQTWDTWEKDLDIQFNMGLHGGDIYQLNIFPNSDLAQHIEKGKVPPAMTTKEQALLYARTIDLIRDKYPHITQFDPSHWASSRRERSLYNTAAKGKGDMLSFGSAAGGSVGTIHFMQQRNLNAYLQMVEEGKKPIAMMMDDGGKGRLKADISAQLESGYLDGLFFKKKWSLDIIDFLRPVLNAWQEKGLITFTTTGLRFTVAGMFWHDNMIQAILECVHMAALEGESDTDLRKDDVAAQDRKPQDMMGAMLAMSTEELISLFVSMRESMPEKMLDALEMAIGNRILIEIDNEMKGE